MNSKILNLFLFSHKPAVTQVDIVHLTFLPISVDLFRVESKNLEEKNNKRHEAICDMIQECDRQWDGRSPVLLSASFQSGRQEWRGQAGTPGLSCFWAGLNQPSWWVRPAPNCSFSLNQRENQTSSITRGRKKTQIPLFCELLKDGLKASSQTNSGLKTICITCEWWILLYMILYLSSSSWAAFSPHHEASSQPPTKHTTGFGWTETAELSKRTFSPIWLILNLTAPLPASAGIPHLVTEDLDLSEGPVNGSAAAAVVAVGIDLD